MKKQLIILLLLCIVITLESTAQVKFGSNVNTLNSSKYLEVEATSGKKVNVNKADGKTFIENKASAISSDSVVMRYIDGELRQISIARLSGYAFGYEDLDGDGIPNMTDPDIDGDGIPNGTDKCPYQYGCLPSGCPVDCYPKSGTITGLTCTNITLSPSSATVGANYAGTITVPYLGGNGGTYSSTSSTSMGLSATLVPGTLTNAGGNFTLNVGGTPTATGTASFVFTFGTFSCTISLPINAGSPVVTNLRCSSAILASPLNQSTVITSNTISVTYEGGNGVAYPAETVSANGITATRNAGTLVNGTGTVVYTLSGTPNATATSASFPITLGGQSCNVNVSISEPSFNNCSPSGTTNYVVWTQGVATSSAPSNDQSFYFTLSPANTYSGGQTVPDLGLLVNNSSSSDKVYTLTASKPVKNLLVNFSIQNVYCDNCAYTTGSTQTGKVAVRGYYKGVLVQSTEYSTSRVSTTTGQQSGATYYYPTVYNINNNVNVYGSYDAWRKATFTTLLFNGPVDTIKVYGSMKTGSDIQLSTQLNFPGGTACTQ